MTKKACVVICGGPSNDDVQRVVAALSEHRIAMQDEVNSMREFKITPHPPADIEYIPPRITAPAYGPKKKRGKGNKYHKV